MRAWTAILACLPVLISCTGMNSSIASRSPLAFNSVEIVAIPDSQEFRVGPDEREIFAIGCHFGTNDPDKIRRLAGIISSSRLVDKKYPLPHFSVATAVLFKHDGAVIERYSFSREAKNDEIWGVKHKIDGTVNFSKYRSKLHETIISEVKSGNYLSVNNNSKALCNFN
jgi:hypothetical protein